MYERPGIGMTVEADVGTHHNQKWSYMFRCSRAQFPLLLTTVLGETRRCPCVRSCDLTGEENGGKLQLRACYASAGEKRV